MKSPSNYQTPGPFFPRALSETIVISPSVTGVTGRPVGVGRGAQVSTILQPLPMVLDWCWIGAGLVLDWCWILRSKKTKNGM